MIMRLSIIKSLLIGLSFIIMPIAQAQENSENHELKYYKRVHKYRENWERLIPTHSKIQFAGNMGVVSLGTGWDYGKQNQWETDLMIGFVPKFSSDKAKVTLTLKENYMPWSVPLNKRFSFEPLSCGLYVNTVFGGDFWVKEPERYPKGYYGFSTKIRFHLYLGQRITYQIAPKHRVTAKSITFYYEVSTCDLYLISAFTNKYLKPYDFLSLSLGVKLQLF